MPAQLQGEPLRVDLVLLDLAPILGNMDQGAEVARVLLACKVAVDLILHVMLIVDVLASLPVTDALPHAVVRTHGAEGRPQADPQALGEEESLSCQGYQGGGQLL